MPGDGHSVLLKSLSSDAASWTCAPSCGTIHPLEADMSRRMNSVDTDEQGRQAGAIEKGASKKA